MMRRGVIAASNLGRVASRCVLNRSNSASRSLGSRSLGSCTTIVSKSHSSHSDVVIPGTSHEYGSLGDSPSPHSKPVSWQAAHNLDIQQVTQKALIYELTQQQASKIEAVVPWFLENMPESYFRQIPETFRMDHIKAIASLKDTNMDLFMNLKSHMPDGREVYTFIRPGTSPGTLLHMLEDLRDNDGTDFHDHKPLTRLHVFSTKDESMSLNMFVYGTKETTSVNVAVEGLASPILEYAECVQDGQFANDHDGRHPSPSQLFEREHLISYLKKCSLNYINFGISNPRRFLQQREIIHSVSGTEGTSVHIEAEENEPGHYWVDVAVSNTRPRVALENVCRLLYLHNFDVTRSRLDVVRDSEHGNITVLRMLVAPAAGCEVSQTTFDVLRREIKRSKWLDAVTMKLVFDDYLWLGVTRGEIITAMCSLIHPVLAKENALVFSKSNIVECVSKKRFIKHAADIATIFLDRFNPQNPLPDEELERRCKLVVDEIESSVEDTVALEILNKMVHVVKTTLKTNVYLPNRYALSLRLDPTVMVSPHEEERELPYGIIFVHGRRFNGYHVRFRDISRGGMRLVTPRSPEQYALESARQYDECYGLAFAQQLKNKDIPEGGSKAVNLVDVSGLSENSRNAVMRNAVKSFTDSILDLIVSTDETRENIADFFGKPETIFLGPDEQVTPEDIDWVVAHAARRGYETPAAFMSSKPRAGINHKEFGVTSEGVNVYLDVALRRVLGIDPSKDSFTIKLTGGPDGDVAGNEIKILVREYGDNAKIVGLADVSGCAEDPDGLDHEELIRLVDNGLSISQFSEGKLGPSGTLSTCNTEEGTKARNTMHNRVVADAFVPCGGRPNTIDINNFSQFLREDGTPSSKLIVEGANLFITAEARKALFYKAGVVIVKDSSANKGGVITSSYEIIAAMLLSEDEFFEHKEGIVGEVLEKLRQLAKLEANLLLTEFETNGGSLPEVSQIISDCINVTTDALSTALDALSTEDCEALLPLFRAHLPQTMADMAFDSVHEKVPLQYIKNAIGSCLASKLVYKEGTNFILSLPKDQLASIALKYVKKEQEIAQLVEKLSQPDGLTDHDRAKVASLLEAGGARTALKMPE
mmetsp:Transcript_10821/g.24126  ORF Transcript_10821/g.24126 Transcript_10821/m.24126 type:complete len:1103 (-) Transcript_10821:262-3570(-)|eukprot:CAMPEP_0168740378 /NCGR_PEP_ID=MMETSP0724-20121128/11952_1 /TAXON_ID=265536 /ORGANISM="Amphiprora sp., Strain CCMP467" /LENGTH=1102 /DNA_ID=CAMNT_0008787819 /DNA_START=153 /DNA_END=3464 /DNA_ORIENTATION=-